MTSVFPAWAQMTDDRRAHAGRVAALLREWANRMSVPDAECARWLEAAHLHDALKDAPSAWLRERVPGGWEADALLHGPAAAAVAAERGETDQGVLDAVCYHSVGFQGWDTVGRMLYLADFLEPGRRLRGGSWSRLRDTIPDDPASALRRVAQARIGFCIEHGMPLHLQTVAFWNSLWRGG